MSVWDSISIDTGDYVSFVNVGDSVTGVITAISTKTWDDGKTDPQLTIRTDDGEKTLTAGQVRLKQWLIENKPAAPRSNANLPICTRGLAPRRWETSVSKGRV